MRSGADVALRQSASRPLAKGRVQIARIWGIGISVHASWLVVFALVTWSLAAGYFPTEFPGWAPATYWLMGALTALVFFLSILIHELGHSWVALRYGIPIRGITLFVFGGVAQISREPASPAAEFRIALAGPLTSLGLAALFAGVWFVTREFTLVAGAAFWLARVISIGGHYEATAPSVRGASQQRHHGLRGTFRCGPSQRSLGTPFTRRPFRCIRGRAPAGASLRGRRTENN